MKLVVTLDSPEHLDLPWPEALPIPVPGDYISMKWGDELIACEVNSREFEIATDGVDAAPIARIRIKGARSLARP